MRQNHGDAHDCYPSLAAERLARARGHSVIAGVDEAGRGCLAGPVVAAAVVLPLGQCSVLERLAGVRDSKLMTARQREAAAAEVESVALAVGVGVSSSWEIDSAGIVAATRRAMGRAVCALDLQVDLLLIDAMRLPHLNCPQRAIIKGDRLCLSIAAASIIAKVCRDAWMTVLHQAWPDYGFDVHKGYPTQKHQQVLAAIGPSPLHRCSFAPVAAAAAQGRRQVQRDLSR